MSHRDLQTTRTARPQRADAQRNQEALLAAATSVFATSGVDAPIREIATQAGIGTATIYRHFPTRADLIIAVYRHQVEALADAGTALREECATPYLAVAEWIDSFVDFVATKQGMAAVLQSDDSCYDPLHDYFLDRLVPVLTDLLEAAAQADEVRADLDAYELMRGIGGICAAAGTHRNYDARRLVELLVAGLRQPQ